MSFSQLVPNNVSLGSTLEALQRERERQTVNMKSLRQHGETIIQLGNFATSRLLSFYCWPYSQAGFERQFGQMSKCGQRNRIHFPLC